MSATPVGGNAGSSDGTGGTDTGFPVKIGGRFNTTRPTLTDGQRGDAQLTSRGALIVSPSAVEGGTAWAVFNNPAANTQATVSQAAAGAGLKNVCTSVTATLTAGSTVPTVPATPVNARLRDGAAGAGTVLWLAGLSITAVAGDCRTICLSGLNIVGTANTAMTLEFGAAGGAGTFEIVSMTGYITA